jgi:hypothetical protein
MHIIFDLDTFDRTYTVEMRVYSSYSMLFSTEKKRKGERLPHAAVP